mmetsp:Transcript_563/g.1858  ORF Transcript_563/g.1858 Transcript_563/m.1858 type:complete len:297 (-) Transcript_563:351-1241(-)
MGGAAFPPRSQQPTWHRGSFRSLQGERRCGAERRTGRCRRASARRRPGRVKARVVRFLGRRPAAHVQRQPRVLRHAFALVDDGEEPRELVGVAQQRRVLGMGGQAGGQLGVRGLPPRHVHGNKGGAELVEHPRVPELHRHVVHPHEHPHEHEPARRHDAHLELCRDLPVVVQVVLVQRHLVVEEDGRIPGAEQVPVDGALGAHLKRRPRERRCTHRSLPPLLHPHPFHALLLHRLLLLLPLLLLLLLLRLVGALPRDGGLPAAEGEGVVSDVAPVVLLAGGGHVRPRRRRGGRTRL